MSHVGSLLQEVQLYLRLRRCDDDLAAEAKAAGCVDCGGTLHSACYPRKPRGGPAEIGNDHRRRSFCCAEDGCRRRVTPPSLRFLGRRVYFGAVVVVMSALRQTVSAGRLASLRRYVGVSWRTLRRWAAWWQDDFAGSRFWIGARSRLGPPPPSAATLPASLLAAFLGDTEAQLMSTLRFLAPITTATAKGGAAF